MRFLAIVVFVSVLGPTAKACSCIAAPPPAVSYNHTPLVFRGTVTEVIERRNDFTTLAGMRVDKAYSGDLPSSIVVLNSGMCTVVYLELGEQYVLYGHEVIDGKFFISGCTRSRHVKHAAEDLEFLDGLDKMPALGRLSGNLAYRIRDEAAVNTPVAGAELSIKGPSGERKTRTDSNGEYTFSDLKPGHYAVTFVAPGFELAWNQKLDTDVRAKGTGRIDVSLAQVGKGRIHGRAIRASGASAGPGVDIELLRLPSRDPLAKPDASLKSTTRDNGEFSFDQLIPGLYIVALHKYWTPREPAPFQGLYWPTGKSRSDAEIIELPEGAYERTIEFHFPPEPRGSKVTIRALDANGKPVVGAGLGIEVNGTFDWATNNSKLETDTNGCVSFQAFEGFQYQLDVFLRKDPDSDSLAMPKERFVWNSEIQTLTYILRKRSEIQHR